MTEFNHQFTNSNIIPTYTSFLVKVWEAILAGFSCWKLSGNNLQFSLYFLLGNLQSLSMSLVAHQFGRVEYLFLFFQLPLYRENFARHIQLFYQKSGAGKPKASVTAVTRRLTCQWTEFFINIFQHKFCKPSSMK